MIEFKPCSFRIFMISVFFVFASLSWNSSASAQFVLEMPDDASGEQIGGPGAGKVQASSWPATRIFSATKTSNCTGTLVGERVLLTAAHCVANGAGGTVKLESGSVSVQFCTHHDDYKGGNSYDYALCLLSEAVDRIEFEVINTSSSYPRKDHQLALLGYGCISDPKDPLKTVSQTNKSLYGGTTTVVDRRVGSTLYIKTVGDVAGCFGDSGGAAYIFFRGKQGTTGREIVGVLSRAWVVKDGKYVGETYISATANIAVIEWMEKWSEENNVSICGISLDALNCRGTV